MADTYLHVVECVCVHLLAGRGQVIDGSGMFLTILCLIPLKQGLLLNLGFICDICGPTPYLFLNSNSGSHACTALHVAFKGGSGVSSIPYEHS